VLRAVGSCAPAILSLVLLAALAWFFDPRAIAGALRSLPLWSLAATSLLLLAGAVLAGLRLRTIAEQIGHRLTFVDAMRAMAFGQIGGTLSIQFFGQVAARTALLRSRGVSLPANIAMASLEKLAAFSVAFTMALGGALWLFGGVVVRLEQGGFLLLHLVVGLAFAVAGSAHLGWGRLALRHAHRFASVVVVRTLIVSVAYTVAIHVCTASAYVVAAKSLVPAVNTFDLVAASFVIMFAASIPISFSGWGIRELSAVFALTAIGVPAGIAVAIAVSIGALSLLAVAALATLSLLLREAPVPAAPAPAPEARPFDIATALAWLVPLAAATLIVAQIRVPTVTGWLNLNPADPFALIGAALFVHSMYRSGAPLWRLANLPLHIAAMTAVIIAAFAIGLASFGMTDWAFFNRTLGWFVLLAYASTGALIFQTGGPVGAVILVRTFIGAVAGVIAMDLVLVACARAGFNLSAAMLTVPLEGLSGNRNALAFLIVMALACIPMIGDRPFVLGCLGAGMWFTGSLAGIGAAGIVFAAAILKGAVRASVAAKAVAAGLWIIALLWLAAPTASLLGLSPSAGSLGMTALTFSGSSFTERFRSMQGGLEMFMSHPVFGAGLGAYMDAQTRIGDPLVIHSSPLWILAEMGAVGLAVFAWFGWRLTQTALQGKTAEGAALLLMVIGFCTMAVVHDMMYQRSIWLLAGALLVSSTVRPAPSAHGAAPASHDEANMRQ
jgi:uncharacterized membrane protein YbhN (UPF0104 family)